MYCGNCGSDIPDGKRFCGRDGVPVGEGKKFCTKTGLLHDTTKKFCSLCGVKTERIIITQPAPVSLPVDGKVKEKPKLPHGPHGNGTRPKIKGRRYSSIVGDKGKVTIPKNVREFLGVEAGKSIVFIVQEDRVVIQIT